MLGWIQSGIQKGHNQIITRNSKYFAYSSFLTVYIMDLFTFNIEYMYFSPNSIISAICFHQKKANIIAISFDNKRTEIVNLDTSKVVKSFSTESVVVASVWNLNNDILLFYCYGDVRIYLYDINSNESYQSYYIINSMMKVLLYAQLTDDVFIGADDEGNILRFNYSKGDYQSLCLDSGIVALDIDQYSPSNCLILWKDGTVGFFEISQKLNTIFQHKVSGRPLGAIAWVKNPPGHYITGDYHTGILRLWSPSSELQIGSYNVYEFGFRSLTLLSESKIFCTFEDYYICVYDMEKCKVLWGINPGHSNTIFTLNFHPKNHDILYSAGAEGIISTWNVDKLKQIRSFRCDNGDRTAIICSDISCDMEVIAYGTKIGRVYFYSLTDFKFLYDYQFFKHKVTSVSFSHFEKNLILVCIENFSVYIFDHESKNIIYEVETSSIPYYAIYSPHEKDVFGVGCTNGELNIFRSAHAPVIYKHTTAIHKYLCWSMEDPLIVFTCTETGSLVVWDIHSTETNASFLNCESNTSRIIVAHPSLKNLIACCGYDGIVRIIDTSTKDVVLSFNAHISHIYTIKFSNENPFLLVTAGRDSTIRFWSIDKLLITQQIENVLNNGRIVFRPSPGYRQLEKLILRISGEDVEFDKDDIIHLSDLVNKLGYETTDQDTFSDIKISSRDVLNEAKEALIAGNARKYCTLMFQAGYHDKAIAAAPSVSFEFWKKLMNLKIETSESKSEKIKYMLLSGMPYEAADISAEQGNIVDAITLAAAATQSEYSIKVDKCEHDTPKLSFPLINNFTDGKYYDHYRIVSSKALNFLKEGKYLLAACSYLSIGDIYQAVYCLLKNGELFGAIEICHRLKMELPLMCKVRFVRLATSQGYLDAIEFITGKEKQLIAGSIPFSDAIHRMKFYNTHNISTDIERITRYDEAFYKLLIGDYNGCGIDSIAPVIETISDCTEWNFHEVKQYIDLFEYLPLDKIDSNVSECIHILTFFLRAIESVWRGYCDAFSIMYNKVIELGERTKLPWAQNLIDLLSHMVPLMPGTGKTIAPGAVRVPITKINDNGTTESSCIGLQPSLTYKNLSIKVIREWMDLTTFPIDGGIHRVFI